VLQRRLLLLCVAASALALALAAAFRLATASAELDFLLWNLALAWVPLVAALALDDVRSTPLYLQLPLLGLWLAFFPNAPYLVTDLIHIEPGGGPEGVLGTAAIVLAVPAGLALAFSSLVLVERTLRERFGGRIALAASLASLAAAAVGIYVGRVIRLNSWDLLSRPREVALALREHALDPHPLAAAATVALAMVLAVLYLRFRRMIVERG